MKDKLRIYLKFKEKIKVIYINQIIRHMNWRLAASFMNWIGISCYRIITNIHTNISETNIRSTLIIRM